MTKAVSRGWKRGVERFLESGEHPLRVAAVLEGVEEFELVERSGWLVVLCACCERPACLRCSARAVFPVTHPWESFHAGRGVCSLGRAPLGWERLVGRC